MPKRPLFAAAIALLLCVAGGRAQQYPQRPQSPLLPRYQANYTATLNSSASVVTVQATSNSDPVSFEEADVYCSAACVITISINGTAATATKLAVAGPIGPVAAASPPLAFSGSNVGGGTALKTFNIAAGATLVLDLTAFALPGSAGGAANFTISTNSITGTAITQIQWVDQ